MRDKEKDEIYFTDRFYKDSQSLKKLLEDYHNDIEIGEQELADAIAYCGKLSNFQFSYELPLLFQLKEKEIEEQLGIDRKRNYWRITVNDIYVLWKQLKRGIRNNTMDNYIYIYT